MSLDVIYKDIRTRSLFWTQCFIALNDNIFKNALVLLVTYNSIVLMGLGSEVLVPIAGGIFILPFFLFSATAGQISDHYQKSVIIKWTKLIEIFIVLIIGFGIHTDNYLVLFIALFLLGTQSSFFGPAKYGIIPELVRQDEVINFTSFVSGGTFLSILVGTVVGGTLISMPNGRYYLIGFLFLSSVISTLIAWSVPSSKQKKSSIKVDYTFLRPTWILLRNSFRKKRLLKYMLGLSWFWFLGAGVLSLIPLLTKNVFGGNELVSTYFLALFTIGMAIGCGLSNKISKGKVEKGILAPALLLISFTLLDIYFLSNNYQAVSEDFISLNVFIRKPIAWRASFDFLTFAILSGLYTIPQISGLQIESEENEVARSIATNNIYNAFFMVSSAVVIGLLSPFGTPLGYLFLCIVNVLFSIIIYYFFSLETVQFLWGCIGKLFYNIEVKGKEHFPKTGPVVVGVNHVSFADWMVVFYALERPPRFVIDWAYYYFPGAPLLFSQAKLIPIASSREEPKVLKKAFELISKAIEDEDIITIFPEGTISRTGKLSKFQPGISKIIRRNPAPVVMLHIDGLWGSIFSYKGGKFFLKWPEKLFRRRKITVTIYPPIAPEDFDFKKEELHFRKLYGEDV